MWYQATCLDFPIWEAQLEILVSFFGILVGINWSRVREAYTQKHRGMSWPKGRRATEDSRVAINWFSSQANCWSTYQFSFDQAASHFQGKKEKMWSCMLQLEPLRRLAIWLQLSGCALCLKILHHCCYSFGTIIPLCLNFKKFVQNVSEGQVSGTQWSDGNSFHVDARWRVCSSFGRGLNFLHSPILEVPLYIDNIPMLGLIMVTWQGGLVLGSNRIG